MPHVWCKSIDWLTHSLSPEVQQVVVFQQCLQVAAMSSPVKLRHSNRNETLYCQTTATIDCHFSASYNDRHTHTVCTMHQLVLCHSGSFVNQLLSAAVYIRATTVTHHVTYFLLAGHWVCTVQQWWAIQKNWKTRWNCLRCVAKNRLDLTPHLALRMQRNNRVLENECRG